MKKQTRTIVEIQESRSRLICQGCGAPTTKIAIEEYDGYRIPTPRCDQHLGPSEENQPPMAKVLEEAIR